jgi:hypothetical protein
MTAIKPPRLAMALIHRFLSDHEALSGDLFEEFARRQSRWWLWTQLIGAIIVTSCQRRRTLEVRPLHLVDERLTPLKVTGQSRLKPIVNLTASPVHGTGGLGIVSLLVLSTALEPGMWGLVAAGVAAGIVVGWVRIIRARRRGFSTAESANHIFTGR